MKQAVCKFFWWLCHCALSPCAQGQINHAGYYIRPLLYVSAIMILPKRLPCSSAFPDMDHTDNSLLPNSRVWWSEPLGSDDATPGSARPCHSGGSLCFPQQGCVYNMPGINYCFATLPAGSLLIEPTFLQELSGSPHCKCPAGLGRDKWHSWVFLTYLCVVWVHGTRKCTMNCAK